MAENLLSEGWPILHTYSKYAVEKLDLNFIPEISKQNNLNKDIQYLEQKERALYQQYGADNFSKFKQNIYEVFSSEDTKVIKRFEAASLQKRLADFALTNKELYEVKEAIKIIIDQSKIQNIKGLKLAEGAKLEFGIEAGEVSVTRLKEEMNKTFGRHFHKDNATATQYLDRFITALTSPDGPMTIRVGKETSPGKIEYTDEYTRYTIPNFPWGVTKDLWEQAKKDNNRSILNEIERATDRIRRFLIEEIGRGGSSEMKQAIESVWDSLFGTEANQARFFSGGKKNFIGAVQGAMGEFQTALIFRFLDIKGISKGKALATIKGNVFLEGTSEQSRTDVEVFRSIGIQVKNFVEIEEEINGNPKTSYLHDITTKIHPLKLSKNFSPDIADSFLAFMANFYFNKDYERKAFGSMVELKYALTNWLGSVMNMAVNDAMQEDTVTFYMFSGKYLVPCSAILRMSQQLQLKNSLKIYGAESTGLTDKGYARAENGEPIYKKYWAYENGAWITEGTDNATTSKNLLSKSISIQTNFNYFDEIEKYALW